MQTEKQTVEEEKILPWNRISGDQLREAFFKSSDELADDGDSDSSEMYFAGGFMDRSGLLNIEHVFSYQGHLEAFMWALCGNSYPQYLVSRKKHPLTYADARANAINDKDYHSVIMPHDRCTSLRRYIIGKLRKAHRMIENHKKIQSIVDVIYDMALDSITVNGYLKNICWNGDDSVHHTARAVLRHKDEIQTADNLADPHHVFHVTYQGLTKLCYYLWQILTVIDMNCAE